jgi:hypothetical protein
MTEQTEPRYGIVTCGKPAPEPAAFLGVCLHTPNHDGNCRFKAPPLPADAYIELELSEDGATDVRRSRLRTDRQDQLKDLYLRRLRNNARVSGVLTLFLCALAIFQVLRALDII